MLGDMIHKGIANIVFWSSLLLLLVFACVNKTTNLETDIVMNPDCTVEFSTQNYCLEQTWAPHVKKITEVKIPYAASDTFKAMVELKILSDNETDALHIVTNECEFIRGEQGEIVFDVKDFNAELGNRYRFQVRFLQESECGMIEIPAGEKYSGGSVDGEELGKAIGLKFTFEKNSKIFWAVASFSPICIALFFSVLWNRKLEETLAMGFIVGVLVMYCFGMLELLRIGIYAVYFLAVICLIGAYALSVKKARNIWKTCTPGVVVYGGIMLYFMVVCRNIVMRGWDEYIHWGLAAKDMYYYDAFSKHIDSCVSLKRYPPFSTLLEYFFMYNNGVFSEGILFVACFAFSFSLLIVALKNITWKKRKYFVSSLMIIVFLPIVFFNRFYTIYVDYLLMVLLIYVLVCYFSEEMTVFNLLRISLALAAMVLVKDMGLLLAGLFIIAIMGNALWNKFCKREVISAALFSIATAFSFISWQIYLKLPVKSAESGYEVIASSGNRRFTAISASRISLSGIWEIISNQADEYKYEVIKKYVNTLLFGNTFQLGYIKFSYVGINLLLIAMAIVFAYQRKRRNTAYKCTQDRVLRYSMMATFISAGYALFLLITYLFTFSQKEALGLASHERYLATCIGGVTVAFCIILINRDNKDEGYIYKTAICSLSVVLVVSAPLIYFLPGHYDTNIRDENIAEFDEVEEVFRSFADKTETVYYVYNNSYNEDLERILFKTYVCPLKKQGGVLYGSEALWCKEEALLLADHQSLNVKNIVSIEKFEESLRDCDYLFLHRPGYTFAEAYGELFEEPELIDDKTYFKVENNAGDIVLHYMGRMS